MRAPAMTAVCAALALASTPACRSAEKCRAAQAQAETAWRAYVDALRKDRDEAKSAQAEARRKLASSIEPRLAEAVRKEVDARYDRSSSAWPRAYEVARFEACQMDAECSEAEATNTRSQERLEDLAPRLEAAKGALASVSAAVTEARAAVEAVPGDAMSTELRAAGDASAAAWRACKGIAQ